MRMEDDMPGGVPGDAIGGIVSEAGCGRRGGLSRFGGSGGSRGRGNDRGCSRAVARTGRSVRRDGPAGTTAVAAAIWIAGEILVLAAMGTLLVAAVVCLATAAACAS